MAKKKEEKLEEIDLTETVNLASLLKKIKSKKPSGHEDFIKKLIQKRETDKKKSKKP